MILASKKYMVVGLVAALAAGGQVIGRAQGLGSASSAVRGGMTSAPGSGAVPVSPEYRIGPEDVLDIVVWGNVDLTKTGVQVRPDGRITLPVVNDIMAAGLTPMDLRNAITKKLEPGYVNQDVSVTVKEVNSLKFSVMGNVRMPNRFLLRSEVTVTDAIAMAGGFAEFAKKDKIYVLRNGKRLPFNWKRFESDPVAADNFRLQAGDIVVVP